MIEGVLTVVATATVNNAVLTQFIGTDRALTGAADYAQWIKTSIATAIAVPILSGVTFFLDRSLFDAGHFAGLRLFALVVLSLVLAAALERAVWRGAANGHGGSHDAWADGQGNLGGAPLLATNTMVLGGVMAAAEAEAEATLSTVLLTAVGHAAGFALALLVIDSLGRASTGAKRPRSFEGPASTLLLLALLSLALSGVTGMGGR